MIVVVAAALLHLGHDGVHISGVGAGALREEPDAKTAEGAEGKGVDHGWKAEHGEGSGCHLPEEGDPHIHQEEERPGERSGECAESKGHDDEEQALSHGFLFLWTAEPRGTSYHARRDDPGAKK